MAYYKIINGVAYDRALIEAVEGFTKGRGEWQVSREEIMSLFRIAEDGKAVTATEWRTLRYIGKNFPLTSPALEWLNSRFDTPDESATLEKTMARIVRQEFDFWGLNWQVDTGEMNRQSRRLQNVVDFPAAVRAALNAFLHGGISQLSIEAVVRRRVLGQNGGPANQQGVRDFMNGGGVLFLAPEDLKEQETFHFDLPKDLDFNTFWHFGLHVPALSPALFMASVLRNRPGFQHSTGNISRRPEPGDIIFAAVRQLAQFTRLKWEIDPLEVARQLKVLPGQNFGEALFGALHVGIFNGESSFSYMDFIRQDIWQDPDRELSFYQREYIESGTLHLLSPNGNPGFSVPEVFAPDFQNTWGFLLEMPKKTDAQFVITSLRELGYDSSWNNGFLPIKLDFEEAAHQVFDKEFGLPELVFIGSEAEFEAQRVQFGANYRTFSSLLRQALNTILHDYLMPSSVFNMVAQIHATEVPPTDFDDPHGYRDAIKHKVFDYLKTGTMEFLPIGPTSNHPVNGEKIEEFWQFQVKLPDLGGLGFWVIIKRFPDDGERPFCYGGH